MKETTDQIMSRLFLEAAGTPHTASIGDALEFRRDQYGLDRLQFAVLLGIQPSHYSEVVTGKRDLPITATKRAYAIGVPAEVLLQQREQSE